MTLLLTQGVLVSRIKTFGKGSKKRVQQIVWRRREILSAILLLLFAAIFSVWLALWLQTHEFDV